MKSSDILRSTNFTYNNLFIKKILDYNLSLSEFILLNYFINYNVIDLNIDEISNHTSLSKDSIFNAYNGLISKNIITINTTNKNGIIVESISLDNFYQKIDESIKNDNKVSSCDKIKNAFENASHNKISDIEEEIINAWIQSGFDENMIINAINESKYNGTCNIRYIDKVLNEWRQKGIKNSNDLESYYATNNIKDEEVQLFDYNWLDDDK